MIAMCDCNNFYASCERLFKPALEGKPVVVLSNNDGCVIARSEEAKELGIEMGTPAFLHEQFFKEKEVQVFSSNYTLYGDISDRVMYTLSQIVPDIEIYSIDEAFLNLDVLYCSDDEGTAKYIREQSRKRIGIPVSVGVANTKTLAKMANRFAKKHFKEAGVFVMDTKEKMDLLLTSTAVEDIWGIGGQYQKKLKINGFHTAYDLTRASDEWIRKTMGVTGLRLVNELRGYSCIKWEDCPSPKKNICTSLSFGQLLHDRKEIEKATANYAATCAAKLRKQKSCAKVVHVFIMTNIHRLSDDQYFRSINIELPVASNSTSEIIEHALIGLGQIYREGYMFKKTGVIVMDLVPESEVQAGLFDDKNREKDKKLMSAIDSVNGSFGKDLVRYAIQGYSKKWKLKAQKLSQRYTTNLNELMEIKT